MDKSHSSHCWDSSIPCLAIRHCHKTSNVLELVVTMCLYSEPLLHHSQHMVHAPFLLFYLLVLSSPWLFQHMVDPLLPSLWRDVSSGCVLGSQGVVLDIGWVGVVWM